MAAAMTRRGDFATPRCLISMTSTRWRDTCSATALMRTTQLHTPGIGTARGHLALLVSTKATIDSMSVVRTPRTVDFGDAWRRRNQCHCGYGEREGNAH